MKTLIKIVETKADRIRFIKCVHNFYENDKNFVPPMISDRLKLIDTTKNPFYKHAQLKLFLAEKNNVIVGRIAAITNELHNEVHKDNIGFFGFFECENNQETANILFDAASKWLKEKGKDAIRGPVNPSMNDELALLIDNFDSPPMILMTYNPPYYKTLIENYGFEKAKDIYAYKLDYKDFATDKIKRMSDLIIKRYDVTFRNVDFKKNFERDLKLIKQIYNDAWEPNWGYVKLTDEEMDFFANDLKQIAEPSLAFFAYVRGELAGFHLSLPNYNQIFKYNKGGSLLKTIWLLLTKKKQISQVRIIILGVLPKFQKMGIDAAIYMQSGFRSHLLKLEDAEASWILEDNEMMNKGLTTTMNGKVYKTYRIFQKGI